MQSGKTLADISLENLKNKHLFPQKLTKQKRENWNLSAETWKLESEKQKLESWNLSVETWKVETWKSEAWKSESANRNLKGFAQNS